MLPSLLLAQTEGEPPPSGNGEIVVTGKVPELPTEREVVRQARQVTQSTGIRHAPLPRFDGDRLCPGVMGLKADFAGLVIDRIRANAERFGLWMTDDDGSCTPNFVVAFVDDGQAILQEIADGRYWLFKDMARHERIEMLADDGPAHVWTTTQTRSRDGMPLPLGPDGRQVKADAGGGVARTSIRVREDITGVTILFDRDDVRDKTLVQLADYATMRGLARTRPVDGDGQVMDTILALFDANVTPPPEMTAFDNAYLGALYASKSNQTGLTTILGVKRELRQQATAETAAAEE
ncbi:hypothetical protein ASD76_17735 [Altererythrobacter sp. Root672]|nr:hypothetical protein ASD76_17735 [Altererythrobacter sp. Root672]